MYMMHDSGDFTLSTLTTSIQFPANSTTQTYDVAVTEDDIANNDSGSWVEATIIAGSSYDLPRNSTARINIIDNEPVISISALTTEVTEGADAEFNINATMATATTRTIQVMVSQTGDFLTNGEETASAQLLANATDATLTLPTNDDNFDEVQGSINAQLLAHPNLIVNPDSSFSNAEIIVNDNDIPEFSLADPTGSVVEGQEIPVVFMANSAPAVDTLVFVSVTGTGNVITGYAPTLFFFRAGLTSVTLLLPTRIDSRDIPDRHVTVTIDADRRQSGESPDYTVDPNASSKVYTVSDLAFPYISILPPGLSWATEGTIFQFELFAASAPVFDIVINLSVQEYVDAESDPELNARSFNYLSDPTENRTVILEAGKRRTQFDVATVDDYVSVGNAQIIVTIRSGDQYRVFPAPSNRARVVVLNNDYGDISTSPLFSISASQSSYEEGMPVTIIIESTRAFQSLQTIFLDLVEQFGDNVIIR